MKSEAQIRARIAETEKRMAEEEASMQRWEKERETAKGAAKKLADDRFNEAHKYYFEAARKAAELKWVLT